VPTVHGTEFARLPPCDEVILRTRGAPQQSGRMPVGCVAGARQVPVHSGTDETDNDT